MTPCPNLFKYLNSCKFHCFSKITYHDPTELMQGTVAQKRPKTNFFSISSETVNFRLTTPLTRSIAPSSNEMGYGRTVRFWINTGAVSSRNSSLECYLLNRLSSINLYITSKSSIVFFRNTSLLASFLAMYFLHCLIIAFTYHSFATAIV